MITDKEFESLCVGAKLRFSNTHVGTVITRDCGKVEIEWELISTGSKCVLMYSYPPSSDDYHLISLPCSSIGLEEFI